MDRCALILVLAVALLVMVRGVLRLDYFSDLKFMPIDFLQGFVDGMWSAMVLVLVPVLIIRRRNRSRQGESQ